MKKSLLLLLLILSSFLNLFAQQEADIMTYNLLNYDSTVDTSRNTYFREIISATQPDILVVEEIQNQYSVDAFLDNVMKAVNSNYNSGNFIANSLRNNFDDNENAIFYDTTKFKFINNTAIHTDLRDINEFKVVYTASNDTLRIYAVHLNAGKSDSTSRASEVDNLRAVTNMFPNGTNFIVLGDFNIYGSYESAYLKLLENTGTDEGYLKDPISLTGTWNYSSYAFFHTQATRTILNNFNYGGLDDRFDMILYSNSISQTGGIKYLQNSTIAYGNDGNHYNKSINEPPNSAVSTTVADALYYASDHLPVIATFQFFNPTRIDDEQTLPTQFALSQNYPNPFNPNTTISYSIPAVETGYIPSVLLKVYDVLGSEVATLVDEEQKAGIYQVKFDASNLSSGIYFFRITASNNSAYFTQTKKMMLLR